MVVTLENKMFFNPFRLGQAENEKVQTDSPKKKAVGEKIVIDAEDLLSIARELESSSNIVHINGKEYTGKKSWIANRLREIVVFKNPRPRNGVDILVKRVIATSGQTVDLKDGKVYVDGRRLDESYAMGESKPLDAHLSSAPDSYPYTIPDGCIWVMGDNRENSADSRYFGPVEEDSVIGIVFARYFPFDRIGSVS